MPAFRCSICTINYPPDVGFRVCPNCDEQITYFTNIKPDDEWRKLLEMKRAGVNLPERIDAPTDAATVVYNSETDSVMVSHADLIRLGYEPQTFDVVKLNGKYYEVWEPTGDHNLWVINALDIYDLLTQVDEFTGEPFEGDSSDDIRQVEMEDGTRFYWDGRGTAS